jgi:hypothetical protein
MPRTLESTPSGIGSSACSTRPKSSSLQPAARVKPKPVNRSVSAVRRSSGSWLQSSNAARAGATSSTSTSTDDGRPSARARTTEVNR